jgi:multiple sugar transport system substrate-binding protein
VRGVRLRCGLALVLACLGCEEGEDGAAVVTFPGSAVGKEAEVLEVQLTRFMRQHPDIRVVQRRTPDAADQRHQLYVQWLDAGAEDPDILQLDVVWTPEFAGAGWIRPLDSFAPPTEDFFPAALAANRWHDKLYALPWFVDVGMLYWRTDLFAHAPRTLAELETMAREALRQNEGLRYGLVWQGARYEGLVTVFVEYLGAHGGAILDAEGEVAVDSAAAAAALTAMRDAVRAEIVPRAALTWHEEETRFAFQNGDAPFMRNWPYAFSLMQNAADSKVAGRFAVAPMPAAPGGSPSACLGGSQLAINANSDEPDAAWAVIDFLTGPAQMVERARYTGQLPARPSLYERSDLAEALPMEAQRAKQIIAGAVARPATPVYTQLSELLQIRLHRALIGEEEPGAALAGAAEEMRALLGRVELASCIDDAQ